MESFLNSSLGIVLSIAAASILVVVIFAIIERKVQRRKRHKALRRGRK
ncbi:MAG: hypothetical protein PHE20_01825 [Patescibacteria group bacterium]|nr:hypothetical protein [Patescibacteria group bacterium]